MEIIRVSTKKELKKFVQFTKKLYKKNYFFSLFSKKEFYKKINKLLKQQKAQAILCVKNQQVLGRVLFTYQEETEPVCYFSFFETINNEKVADLLFQYIFGDMEEKGVKNLISSVFPYSAILDDGILIKGFEKMPMIHSSFQYEYYQELLENIGFNKVRDFVSYQLQKNIHTEQLLNESSAIVQRRYDISIEKFNLKNKKNEIEDILRIFKSYYNFEVDNDEVLIVETFIKTYVSKLIDDYFLIAREKQTNEPIGFILAVPNYNKFLLSTEGKYRKIIFRLKRKKITGFLGEMMYIVPRYQNTDLALHLFNILYRKFSKIKNFEFEVKFAEGEHEKIKFFKKIGAKKIKIYRIYKWQKNEEAIDKITDTNKTNIKNITQEEK